MTDARGEITLTLDGEDYTLRPTFDAIRAIETGLGVNLLPLVMRMQNQDVGVRDAAVFVTACARAGGHEVSESEIGARLMGADLVAVWVSLLAMLTDVVTGGTEKNEPAAAESHADAQ